MSNNISFNLNAHEIFKCLDARDGKSDGYIIKKEWDAFANIVHGNTINWAIKEENALRSINYYLKKISEETKKTVAEHLGAEFSINTSEVKKQEPNNCQKSSQNVPQGTSSKINVTKSDTRIVQKRNPEKSDQTQTINTQQQINNSKPFEKDTIYLNGLRFNHKTDFLRCAQDSLGLYEITAAEYEYLAKENPEELKNTQAVIVGEYGMKNNHQWCAYTVGYLAQKAGLSIKKFSTVQAYINEYKEDYNQISSKDMTKDNYNEERLARAEKIRGQLPNMHEGDFIIWKGNYVVPQSNGLVKESRASHIGIIEHVDLEKGIVTVIEGNANVSEMNEEQERVLVRTKADCKRGAQTFGEYKDVNNRDGLIRKQYTVEELAKHGYTGFIDNSSRVK